MNEHDDPLWNPAATGDEYLRRLERQLASFSVAARGLAEWQPVATAGPVPLDESSSASSNRAPRMGLKERARRRAAHRPRWRHLHRIAAAIALISLLLVAAHFHRLAWTEGEPWRVTATGSPSSTMRSALAPGESIRTAPHESLHIAVARIGEITLAPESTLRLLETGEQRHRVDLQSGHLRARIWAPPGYFGVSDALSETIDLGCEFDLWKRGDGSGRVRVSSGWIVHTTATQEILVPAGHELTFDARHASPPRRVDASATFSRALDRLDALLERDDDVSIDALAVAADALAEQASDRDAFTLLALLSEHPSLATGSLYRRLGDAFGVPHDPAHRAAWARGDQAAIASWWERLPRPPKHWWSNWMDAF
jgi:hypothetical protein